MTTTEELAEFVDAVSHEEFSENTREELKKRTLDSLGIGIAALGHEPVEDVHDPCRRANLGTGCTLWGRSESASPVGAAMYNTALTRYLDFMDSFLAPGETPHPSDNIGAVVAAGDGETGLSQRLDMFPDGRPRDVKRRRQLGAGHRPVGDSGQNPLSGLLHTWGFAREHKGD